MKVVDIANEIYINIGQPTYTNIPAISFWIRAKIGTINNLLFEDFVIDTTTFEIGNRCGEISPEAVAIIKQMYTIYDFEYQIRANMNALQTDTIIKVEDNGSSVTKVNRNEVSKTLQSVRKDEIATLQTLVTSYRLRGTTPQQVTGDDTIPEFWPPYPFFFRR